MNISENRFGKNRFSELPFKYFGDICRIPHGSGNERALSEYICVVADGKGLKRVTDAENNVVVYVPGNEGFENRPAVIIQNHIDMVCEKNNGTPHDFINEGIKARIDGDFIKAGGTTLGADNGIGAAMALALTDADMPHPPLELLFTTGEETGMYGAVGLDPGLLTGRMLLNLDSEEEGVFCVSCAGGVKAGLSVGIDYTEPKMNLEYYVLSVGGLKGGHSGMDINKWRGNAIDILGEALSSIYRQKESRYHISVAGINGGMKDNAIPREAEAVVGIATGDVCDVIEAVSGFNGRMRRFYGDGDPGISVRITKHTGTVGRVFGRDSTDRIIKALNSFTSGVLTMSRDIPGLPESSRNLGIIKTAGDKVTLDYCLRSSVSSEKESMVESMKKQADEIGVALEFRGDYPAWEYDPGSRLRGLLTETHMELYGSEPRIEATHAGLECGIFAEKFKGIDIISFGPDITGAHTPEEKVNIPSVQRTWEFLCAALERLAYT